ncbi:MAG: HAMP domain-containing histidine kinase [Actinomycetota bacterium]|nr:HAMP domain-containing histidine kinase [Actinomycetota bacterium]MDP9486130.1 HAMP domain-containing histidine kinase [Actinomycetota bacterium]
MPIRWRLTLFNALVIGAILLASGTALFFFVREALLSGVEEAARNRALAVARTVEAGKAVDEDELGPPPALEGVFALVRDEDGRVLARSFDLPARAREADTAWRRALQSGRPAEGTLEVSEESPAYVYAVPVDGGGGRGARVVEAGRSYESAHKTLETLAAALVAVVLVAVLLSVVGAYLLARAALSPVAAVAAAARRIKESDLSERLPVGNPNDEIGGLTATMNGLLSRLEAAFARREEALSRLEEALGQQRRFVADASHELRTPLTNIEGYSEMLRQWALRDPETAGESVEAIEAESRRMRGLVEGLLALARGDEGPPLKPETQDLGALTAEAVRSARAAAGGKVAVEYEPPGRGEVVAVCDRTRIGQALSVLLDNAIKYTPEGGEVRVEARTREEVAELEVSDTGAGIPAEQLPLVFERFYRGDSARTRGGAGLGLAIARQIAEAHGGSIEARSEPGKGSAFVLRIPKKRPAR